MAKRGQEVQALANGIVDVPTQRAIRALERALNDQTEALGNEVNVIDSRVTIVEGGVSSVSAGSAAITVSPTTGNVVVDIGAVPEANVTGLVSDLAARPTGSGTAGRSARWATSTSLNNGAFTDDGTNASLGGTLTVTTMTPGSVLFAGTGGLVSQDNANLFWDDANNRLGIGTASPSNPVSVKSTGTSDMVSIQNTDATLWSTYVCRDNGGTVRVAYGYGNASTADTPRNSRGHIWLENGTDFVMMKGGAIPGTALLYMTNSNGNMNVGSTLGDPLSKLRVEGRLNVVHPTSAEPAVILRNTSSSGYTATDLYDSGNTFKGAYGYANGSVGVTHLQSQLYLYSGGPDWNFANGTRNEVVVGMTSGSTFLQMQNGSSAAVSTGSTGRVRYSTGTSTLQVSLNAGAYANLVTGVGTTGKLPKFSAGATSVLADSLVSESGSVVTVSGDLSITGAATLGDATGDAHTINGAVTQTDDGNAYALTATPTATTADVVASSVTLNGTLNATAAVRAATGIKSSVTTTRSAGANNLTNTALYGTATGGQVNQALVTDDGNVVLNKVSGTTTIKGSLSLDGTIGNAHALTGSLALQGGAGSDGQVIARQGGLPTWVALSTISGVTGLGSNNVIPMWNGATALTTSLLTVLSSGTLLQSTYSRGITVLSVNDATVPVIGIDVAISPTASAFSNTAVRGATGGSTHNTTAGALTVTGGDFQSTATKSSGANTLTNRGLYANASGGDVNIALLTDGGNVVLNNSSGTTTIKGATTIQSTLDMNSHKINNVTDPTSAQDAATKNYVDTLTNRLIGRQVLSSASGTYTPTTGTKRVLLRMVGGGGGGGGASGGANAAYSAGGTSGVYWEKWIDPGATVTGGTYHAGGGGAGGGTAPADGTAGTDTDIIVNSTTYTAKGGTGGLKMINGSGNTVANTGGASGASSAADVIAQDIGMAGWKITANDMGVAGAGGSGPWGIGGAAVQSGSANGTAGTGNGAGGGGTTAFATGRSGGAGSAGLIIIEEYA